MLAAELGRPLLLQFIWNAGAVPKGRSWAVRDGWLAFVEANVSDQVPPMTRVLPFLRTWASN